MSFICEIISWYRVNKRQLPWRHTNDPYIIWLSEIILQQTRVDQGLPYFHKFLEEFPTVSDFASASEDEVLKLWQGLGYYSRARNMHQTARMVMEDFEGYFPKKYDELITLRGIGSYTAAAIASFSANEPRAVVDGNVFRLLSRYFGIYEPINSSRAKKVFTELADSLIDPLEPGLSNQAIMEFGSLQCRPKNPDCSSCPLRQGCHAFAADAIGTLPVKNKSAKSRDRYFNYIVAIQEDAILMKKRDLKDIWQNLWDFPLIETNEPVQAEELLLREDFRELFGKPSIGTVAGPVKHILSHQNIHAQFIFLKNFAVKMPLNPAWRYIKLEEMHTLAQPKLIFGFFKNFSKLIANSIIA